MRTRLCSARRSSPPTTSSDAVVAGDPAHGLRRLDRPATREHAEPREQPLILRVEQVVAPVDRAAQRPLPLRQVARPPTTAGPAGRPGAAPSRPARAAGSARPRARSPAAGRRAGARSRPRAGAFVGGQREVRAAPPSRARRTAARPRTAMSGVGVGDAGGGQRQRRDRELLLAGDPQRGPARDDHRQPGRRAEEVGDDRRAGDDLLEVVQHEQRGAVAEVLLDAVDRRPLRGEQADRRGDRRRDEVGSRHRRERHEPGAVREARRRSRPPRRATAASCRCRRGPSASAGASGRGASPRRRPRLAPDERGELRRQVVGRQVERLERRERRPRGRRVDLVQPLRPGEVLEPVLAEVAQGEPAGSSPATERARRVGDDDLAAVRRPRRRGPPDGPRCRRSRARSPRASPVWIPMRTRTSPPSHACAASARWAATAARIAPAGGSERREHGVALVPERSTPRLVGRGLPHQRRVACSAVDTAASPMSVEQARRALDVREQEGDEPSGSALVTPVPSLG